MDYNARFYSPTLGKFTQPDSIIPNPTGSQNWNRYSYVLNNPINANDPSGHKCVGEVEECLEMNAGKLKPITAIDKPFRPGIQPRKDDPCSGPHPSVVCVKSNKPQVDLPGPIPTYGDGLIGPPAPSPSPDEFFQTIEFGKEALSLIDLVENGMLWGRPIYKQVKYAVTLGPIEYGIDAVLQLYDDRNKNLSFGQCIGRAGVRYFESWAIDGVSTFMGGMSGGALQASVPIPGVSAGVGFVVGSYTTSSILENIAKSKNEELFNLVGFGEQ